jgi:hypothetical protein
MLRMRWFARLISTRANYRIGTGDINGAIDDLITCKRLGRCAQSQRTPIWRLSGLAAEGIADGSCAIAAHPDVQPSAEHLQRLVAELDALPRPPGIDQTILAARYYILDSLQAVAHGDETLDSLSAAWWKTGAFQPNIAARLPVDWNTAMRRVNARYDSEDPEAWVPTPPVSSLAGFFIGLRSRQVGDRAFTLSIPDIVAFREDNDRVDCGENLLRITLAMLMYERAHGSLPPAYTVDADGKPLHSWRVLLLPYLGQQYLYDKLHLDEPWDSDHNRPFHAAAPAVYQCPSALLTPSDTTYSVVVGQRTAFAPGTGKSLDDFGTNLILVVERNRAVCWMDPASDLSESIAVQGIQRWNDPAIGVGSPHLNVVAVGVRNGSARIVSDTIDPSTWQGLLYGTAQHSRY